MLIHVAKITNYNNNILIAPDYVNTGEITSLNTNNIKHQTNDLFQSKRKHDLPAMLSSTQLPLHVSNMAKEHEEKKQALIIGGVLSILLGLYIFTYK